MKNTQSLVGMDITELFRDCPDCCRAQQGWDNLCPRCDGYGAVPTCPACGSTKVEVEITRDNYAATHAYRFSCSCGTSKVKVNDGGSIISCDITVSREMRDGGMIGKDRDEVSGFFTVPIPVSGYPCPPEWKAPAAAPMCPKHGLSKIPGSYYGPGFANPEWVCPECRSAKEIKKDLAAARIKPPAQSTGPAGIKTACCPECGVELSTDFYGRPDSCRNPECRDYVCSTCDGTGEVFASSVATVMVPCPECRGEEAAEKAYFENESRRIAGNAVRVAAEVLRRREPAPEPEPVGLVRVEVPDSVEVPPEVLARFRNLGKL